MLPKANNHPNGKKIWTHCSEAMAFLRVSVPGILRVQIWRKNLSPKKLIPEQNEEKEAAKGISTKALKVEHKSPWKRFWKILFFPVTFISHYNPQNNSC
jgi:hypothetical protein